MQACKYVALAIGEGCSLIQTWRIDQVISRKRNLAGLAAICRLWLRAHFHALLNPMQLQHSRRLLQNILKSRGRSANLMRTKRCARYRLANSCKFKEQSAPSFVGDKHGPLPPRPYSLLPQACQEPWLHARRCFDAGARNRRECHYLLARQRGRVSSVRSRAAERTGLSQHPHCQERIPGCLVSRLHGLSRPQYRSKRPGFVSGLLP